MHTRTHSWETRVFCGGLLMVLVLVCVCVCVCVPPTVPGEEYDSYHTNKFLFPVGFRTSVE